MAQKRKPNIRQKPVQVETKKTEPVVIVKSDPAKAYSRNKKPVVEKGIGLLFDKRNYLLMIGGVLLVIIGFLLMSGGGSDDPKVFNMDLFDARRLTVAPIFVLLGYAVEVVAIMLKPKQKAGA